MRRRNLAPGASGVDIVVNRATGQALLCFRRALDTVGTFKGDVLPATRPDSWLTFVETLGQVAGARHSVFSRADWRVAESIQFWDRHRCRSGAARRNDR